MADTVITIVPVRDPDQPGSCLLSWQGRDWIAPLPDVRATAVDLFTVAAYADLMILMAVRLRLDPGTVSAMASDLISQTGRTSFGTEQTISLLPVGSSKKRQGLVLIRRQRLEGVVDTATARQMGLTWLAAAEAAESDQLVTEALRTAGGIPEERIEGLFAYLRELRSKGAAPGAGRE